MGNPRNLFLITALAVTLLATQSLTCQPTTPQSPTAPVPDWQSAAGGKMVFDAASIKQNISNETTHTNVGLSDLDEGPPNGGLFAAVRFPVAAYIGFAYKLTPSQVELLEPQLPKWATTERFDIQGRAEGSPTRNQMRLMIQSLLADRFHLAIHHETRQLPVFELLLDKRGKTGPRLIRLSDDVPCGVVNAGVEPPPPKYDGWFTPCGGIGALLVSGRVHIGSQNTSMALFVEHIAAVSFGSLDLSRPIVDQTGLSGKFDFTIEFTPDFHGAPPPNFQPDASGPTFLEALKEQLGLKLESSTGKVEILVIDHIEEPSPN